MIIKEELYIIFTYSSFISGYVNFEIFPFPNSSPFLSNAH